MERKTPQQTNILVHLVTWTLGTPLLFILLAGGIFSLIQAPSHETLTVSVIAAFIGLIVGFPLGVISFFVVRGARGWGRYFDERRAEKSAEEESVLIERVEDSIVARLSEGEHDLSDDPWNGTNPYGCCQSNYDEEGNLSHGGADCLHPLILEQRRAS